MGAPLIYIIDDELHIIDIVEETLKMSGYTCRTFLSAAQALEHIEKDRPALIICDIQMPEMSGTDFLEAVRASEAVKLTPFLFLTGQNTSGDILNALSLGANDYLVKPVYPRTLLKSVKRHLDTQQQLKDQTLAQWEAERKQLKQQLRLTFHDLMGVMGNVYTLACYLNESSEESDDYELMIDHIKSQSETAVSMLKRLMEKNKSVEDNAPEYVSLDRILNEVLESLTFHIYDKALEVQRPQRDIQLRGNLHLWCSIFYNLLSNSVKFTPRKGRISIRVESLVSKVNIYVEDTGIGIPQKKQQQLFKQKVTSSKDQNGRRGNGVGLFLCADIARSLDAELTLERSDANGSSFKIHCHGK